MGTYQGIIGPRGSVQLRVIRANPRTETPAHELNLLEIMRYGMPRLDLSDEVRAWRVRNLPNLLRGLRRVLAARKLGIATLYGTLSLVRIRADGQWEDFGLASMRVVTTAGVNFLADALQGTVEPEILKFHGIGTGSTSEAVGDTALVTELSTAYNPNDTRATGSLTEGASANIFRTVGTNTVDAVAAITEHGIFSQAATGGGVLLDRSVFSVVNLASGDSLQTTYDLTIAAGS